jgi:hypothetical protein
MRTVKGKVMTGGKLESVAFGNGFELGHFLVFVCDGRLGLLLMDFCSLFLMGFCF